MKRISLFITLFVAGALALPAYAADKPDAGKAKASAPAAKSSITHGRVTVEGNRINYDAKAGTLILKNKDGKPIASMSYVAYFKADVKNPGTRPITFFYNGGPGSSTIWLHMLGFGPKIVRVGNGELTPPAPYQFENNSNSLLDATDMVFVDAPGTGFGRVIGKDKGGAGTPKDVYGIDEDAHAFSQFITQFITDNNRWTSPKFLFGESYGTIRSAVLSNVLETEDTVGLNGVVLLSSILNWSISVDLADLNPGINISYAMGLPSYAATAWYHHKLPDQPKELGPFLKKVEQFATGPYISALHQGDQIDPAAKRKIAEQMHEYTGLPVDYILKANLKVTGGQFAHELLGADSEVTGRLDSRYSGPMLNPMGSEAGYDPLNSAIGAPTVAEFNSYVRNTLKFGKDMTYKPEINVFKYWDFKHQPPGAPFPLPFTPNVMPDLASAMTHNPNLKVMLAGGYFDLGTPYYGAIYDMHQLPMTSQLKKNVSYAFFPSGHMVYLDPASHKSLHDKVAKFIESNYKH